MNRPLPIKIAFLFNKYTVLDKKCTFLFSLLNLLGAFVTSLGLKDRNEIAVFETIVKISEKCQETNKSVTPYKIDKILWLICSGRYYHHNIETKSYKKEFIESLKLLSKPWQELLR